MTTMMKKTTQWFLPLLLIHSFISTNVSLFCLAKLEEGQCQQPQVYIGNELVIMDESRFSKHFGSYPPTKNKNDDGDGNDDNTQYFILNSEKPVLYVKNFLNQSVANELKEFCISGGRFVRSHVRGYSGDVSHDEKRTSESCTGVPAVVYRNNPAVQAMFGQDPVPPDVANVAREVDIAWDVAIRASKIINVDPNTVEPLQLVRYTSPDAEYKLHHDHGGYYGKTTEIRPWTMLVFLNDVSDGGRTAFPKLDLEVVPRAGDALIWSNIMTDANNNVVVDKDMVHAGKPPSKEGIEKYALNVWFGSTSFQERVNEGRW
jgi:prolyl 4-hydroxylase